MTDFELSNIILKKYYEKRKEDPVLSLTEKDFDEQIAQSEIYRISQQLDDDGFIKFDSLLGNDRIVDGVGIITVKGIQYIEGKSLTSLASEVTPTSNWTIFNQEGQHVGMQYYAAGDMHITHPPSQSAAIQAVTRRRSIAPIRRALTSAFDDVGLNSFCLDYFEPVYDEFTRGMQRKEKIDLLLNHCRRAKAFPFLLDAVQQEITHSPYPRQELVLLVNALQSYLKAV